MIIEHLEVLVEDASMEAALKQLLPKISPSISFALHSHQGKGDLLAKLPSKLSAYAKWLPPTYRVLIALDRDGDSCVELKQKLDRFAAAAGLSTKSVQGMSRPVTVINRLAIEELEAWFFGDWAAVRSAYPGVAANIPAQAKYRTPDDAHGSPSNASSKEPDTSKLGCVRSKQHAP